MLHAGIDLHKKFSVVTVISDDGELLVKGQRLENDEVVARDFLDGFDSEVRVALEAGPNWNWMCDLLDGMGVENKLCHPLKTKAIGSAKIKTDKIDSLVLARLLKSDFIAQAHKADLATRQLRELVRMRAYLVKSRTGYKNKVHAVLTRMNIANHYSDLFCSKGIVYLKDLALAPAYRNSIDAYLQMIESLDSQIGLADELVHEQFLLREDARLLATTPGIGEFFGLMIAAEIGDISRFSSARSLASCSGLIPSTSQSGNTTRHGRITRQGSAWLRYALVEATIHAVARPGALKAHYARLSARKGKYVARTATARKLCTYIYHMLNEGRTYDEVIAFGRGDLG
jgi:transposase